MDSRAYDMMAENEAHHWWWEGRRAVLSMALESAFRDPSHPRGDLYDLGCGNGSNLEVLAKYGRAVGFDGSELAVEAGRLRGRDVRLADLALGLGGMGNVARGSASVVLLADVLEHLDDEKPAIHLAYELLAPGGTLIVTVPAFPALWSASDVRNHHRRRYTRSTLDRAVSLAFEVRRMTYFNSVLLGPIAVARVLSKAMSGAVHQSGNEESVLPFAPLNAVLRAAFRSEARLLRHTDFPAGVSLLCIARKPDGIAS